MRIALPGPPRWLTRLIARPSMQALVERVPLATGMARRDGAEIFGLLQGFVASQVLAALVELDILQRLLDRDGSAEALALNSGIAPDRMQQLLQAGVALELLRRTRRGQFGLTRKGAAILGVPGLLPMIRHNRALYADMADPVALLRGEGETHLQRFWPYVFGADAPVEAPEAATYSDLMAQSQVLVARDTLRMISLRGVSRLMDIGGGSGVFLSAALRASPGLTGTLVDLPAVMPDATRRFAESDLMPRVTLHPGDFRTDPLPGDADAICLIRVLYDHDDDTVRALLAKALAALPVGGRLIVSEPMSGGSHADPVCDVYFAFYTMAMGTGRVRSADRIAALCEEAGFGRIQTPRPLRPYITRVVEAVRLA